MQELLTLKFFPFFPYSYHSELLCALFMNFLVMGVELRLSLFYLVEWVMGFVSYCVLQFQKCGGWWEKNNVNGWFSYFYFSLQANAFFTWSCITFILIATNNYSCAPWELKPFACTDDNKTKYPNHNKLLGKAGFSFICHYFSIFFSTSCQNYQSPVLFCNYETDTQRNLSSSPSK